MFLIGTVTVLVSVNVETVRNVVLILKKVSDIARC